MKIMVRDPALAHFSRRQLPSRFDVSIIKNLSSFTRLQTGLQTPLEFSDINIGMKMRQYQIKIGMQQNQIETDLSYSNVGRLMNFVNGNYAVKHLEYYLAVLFPILLDKLRSDLTYLPFHATVVEVDGKNIMILGAPGAGKSSSAILAAKYGGSVKSDNLTFFSGTAYWGFLSPIRLASCEGLTNYETHQAMRGLYEISLGENQLNSGSISKIIYLSKGSEYLTSYLNHDVLPHFMWRDAVSAPEYRLLLELLTVENFPLTATTLFSNAELTLQAIELPHGAFAPKQEDKTWQHLFS